MLPAGNKKSKYWKFILRFFAVIIGVLILYIIGFWAVRAYEQWRGEKEIQELAEALKRVQEEDYQKALADTYGGKTPQETLQMYIDAVEKGDYELASKYFIEDYQWKGLVNLNNKSEEGIKKYITVLKESIKSQGGYYPRDYIPGGEEFIIDVPIYIRMKIYPNGIWKIIEI